jgi:hypothetical protein
VQHPQQLLQRARDVQLPVVEVRPLRVTAYAAPRSGCSAAALVLGFVILALIYGTALVAQLTVHEQIGSFADGVVDIEHPTFALALIKLATLTLVPAELVPPIVTG